MYVCYEIHVIIGVANETLNYLTIILFKQISPELKPHHKRQFSVYTFVGDGLNPLQGMQSVFLETTDKTPHSCQVLKIMYRFLVTTTYPDLQVLFRIYLYPFEISTFTFYLTFLLEEVSTGFVKIFWLFFFLSFFFIFLCGTIRRSLERLVLNIDWLRILLYRNLHQRRSVFTENIPAQQIRPDADLSGAMFGKMATSLRIDLL